MLQIMLYKYGAMGICFMSTLVNDIIQMHFVRTQIYANYMSLCAFVNCFSTLPLPNLMRMNSFHVFM